MFTDVGGRGAQFIWRVLLGMRLRAAPDRVAGWQIADRGEDWIRIEATSWFLTGHLVVQADDEHVSLATFIRYDRPLGGLRLATAVHPAPPAVPHVAARGVREASLASAVVVGTHLVRYGGDVVPACPSPE